MAVLFRVCVFGGLMMMVELSYCSRECQAKRWSVHKKDCRRVQKERARAAASSAAADGKES